MKSSRIFFLATDNNIPSGGRKFIYKLVDLLREQGQKAYVLHQRNGFRYSWFANETPVRWTPEIQIAKRRKRGRLSLLKYNLNRGIQCLSANKLKTSKAYITDSDILVLPENRVTHLHHIFPGVPKVVLNQNPYFFLYKSNLSDVGNTIRHPDIQAWWSTSNLIEQTLKYIGISQPNYRIPYYIDHMLFHYSASKKKQIAYMPRRLKDDAIALINLLKLRGKLQGFRFVPIDGKPPEEVATILRESMIFLSFSYREGFGLPPAEAMACGCIVVGYTGNAGKEFMDQNLCYPICEGDLIDYASKVEKVIEISELHPQALTKMAKQASEFILRTYNRQNTADALKKALSGSVESKIAL